MLSPYPEILSYKTTLLDVDPVHSLHIEETGSPKGLPVFVLHDGPGIGSDPYHRRLFDAERFRIIEIDQRGCGRSQPLADVEGNSVAISKSDLTRVMDHLGVEAGILVGFGWGGYLAVQYAEEYPEKVLGLLLCGYGLCDSRAVSWLLKTGAPSIFPDHWFDLMQRLDATPDNLIEIMTDMLMGANELDQIQAAKAWARWLAKISTLHCQQSLVEQYCHPHNAIAIARLGIQHLLGLSDQPVCDPRIRTETPCVIVHGRYDAVCPLEAAYHLHGRVEGSRFYIVRDAGHSPHDPAMADTLIRAISELADKLEGRERLNG